MTPIPRRRLSNNKAYYQVSRKKEGRKETLLSFLLFSRSSDSHSPCGYLSRSSLFHQIEIAKN